MDCIRAACPDSVIFEVVETKVFTQYIWPELKGLMEDPSWKVRFACMEHLREVPSIYKICQSAGKNGVSKLIFPLYLKALSDKELEVSISY